VLGGSLDPIALRALWSAGRPLTGEQVARVARAGSPRGIRYALARLVDQGIVSASTVGSATLYALNTEHLAYPAVDAAFRALDPWPLLRSRVAALVSAQAEAAEGVSVAVFGSVARGDSGPGSDLDLLLVVPADDAGAATLRTALSERVRAWTGQQVGVYLTTPTRLAEARAADDPIVGSFARDAVTLSGPDVRTYLSEA
jgi:predicted nucleotidyltransferase